MSRKCRTKIEILERRYPGLDDKLERMFDEAWASRDVVQMLASQYGEHLSTSTVERFKRKHWQAQRELVEEMSEIIDSLDHRDTGSGHLFIGSSNHLKNKGSIAESPCHGRSGRLFIGSSNHLKIKGSIAGSPCLSMTQ
jgi:hypothetical protein